MYESIGLRSMIKLVFLPEIVDEKFKKKSKESHERFSNTLIKNTNRFSIFVKYFS